MTELVGRFLSFEEHFGRGLIRFVYYLLLFLLVATSLWEVIMELGKLGSQFWASLWHVLVSIPLFFIVKLLLLRLCTEVILSISAAAENLQGQVLDSDVMSSGLNVGEQTGTPSPNQGEGRWATTPREAPSAGDRGTAPIDDHQEVGASHHSDPETEQADEDLTPGSGTSA